MMRKLLVAAVLSFAIVAQAQAGVVKKTVRRAVAVAGVAAVAGAYMAAKKACNPVTEVDPDTGRRSVRCVRPSTLDESVATERASSTYELRKALNEERVSAGLPPDPDGCDAHHIVPKSENRPWAREMVSDARKSISGCLDIDSAENGVYLPSRRSGANCTGKYHKTIHTKQYYDEISSRLADARSAEGCEGVKNELANIKDVLSSGGSLW